jgi:membrane protein implicated in regulation of membrane protease activity
MDFLIPIFNTLVIAVAGILLMVGLMSAPWQVLLLILVLGVWLSKWLIRRSQLQEVLEDLDGLSHSQTATNGQMPLSSEPAPSIDTTTLSYRGASYMPPTNQASENNSESYAEKDAVSGKYRGGIWTA